MSDRSRSPCPPSKRCSVGKLRPPAPPESYTPRLSHLTPILHLTPTTKKMSCRIDRPVEAYPNGRERKVIPGGGSNEERPRPAPAAERGADPPAGVRDRSPRLRSRPRPRRPPRGRRPGGAARPRVARSAQGSEGAAADTGRVPRRVGHGRPGHPGHAGTHTSTDPAAGPGAG